MTRCARGKRRVFGLADGEGHGSSSWRHAGFTLIEMMVVTAIIAILAAIAVPTYLQHVTKANRVAAEGCLSQYSSFMERYYTTYLRYDQAGSGAKADPVALPQLDCSTNSQTGRFYQYKFASTPQPTTYQINAIPQGAQLTRDTLCGTLSLDQAGNRGAGPGQVSDCW